MESLKQAVGIDVSKDTLELKFKESDGKQVKIKGSRKFNNSLTGFKELLFWSEKRQKTDQLTFVMEATGVYHEELLYFLYENKKRVVVELPQRIKYYAKSKGVKTKNDKVDCSVIADYGLERTLSLWQPPSPKFKSLRDLSRENSAIKANLNSVQNRLHAAKHSKDKLEIVIKSLEEQIEFLKALLKKIEKAIKKIVNEDKVLKEKISKVATIKGVGLTTIVTAIAETGGFYLFENIKQLISYAGLDVVENQSGKYNGKTHISKKGNVRLRAALYMPALSAINHNPKMTNFNQRIMTTHKYKKQGIVAVMRKLLILIYTLWKKDEIYDPNYQWGYK